MTDPSRTSPATSEKADTDPPGPNDPTHPRAEEFEPHNRIADFFEQAPEWGESDPARRDRKPCGAGAGG